MRICLCQTIIGCRSYRRSGSAVMRFIKGPTERPLIVLKKASLIFVLRAIMWRQMVLLFVPVSTVFWFGIMSGVKRGSRCLGADHVHDGLPLSHRLRVVLCKPFRLADVDCKYAGGTDSLSKRKTQRWRWMLVEQNKTKQRPKRALIGSGCTAVGDGIAGEQQ